MNKTIGDNLVLPEQGQMVETRHRRWLATEIKATELPNTNSNEE